jgi:hypothetical protein
VTKSSPVPSLLPSSTDEDLSLRIEFLPSKHRVLPQSKMIVVMIAPDVTQVFTTAGKQICLSARQVLYSNQIKVARNEKKNHVNTNLQKNKRNRKREKANSLTPL